MEFFRLENALCHLKTEDATSDGGHGRVDDDLRVWAEEHRQDGGRSDERRMSV